MYISYIYPSTKLPSNEPEARIMEDAMEAAMHGDYETFQRAFKSIMALGEKDKSGISIHSTTENGMNLAHCAVLGNNVDILKMIHKAGVNLNARDAEGKTPIYLVSDRIRRNSEKDNARRRNETGSKSEDPYGPFIFPNEYVNPEILSYLKNADFPRPSNLNSTLKGCSENITKNSNEDLQFEITKEKIR